ncbi:unnamed protein product [Ostreobium quekettii]|uniref:F-box/LRR-repeat protein 15-like leucin rich repeat domain-containing protein n=1 Tax=Ostreobium quekettii TaxID=121088 RepID=A0A8S1IR00_9CHLO|nr:unnamed protein product [Ostreobium quekettii]
MGPDPQPTPESPASAARWCRLPRDIIEALLPRLRNPELRALCGANQHWNACLKGAVTCLRPSHFKISGIPPSFTSLMSIDLGACWADVDDALLTSISGTLPARAGVPQPQRLPSPYPVPVRTRVGYSGVDGDTVGNLTLLRDLDLSWNPVSDQSLRRVVALTGLTRLVLAECPAISDQGVECLRCLSKLRSLSLSGTMVSDEGLAAIAESLGNLRSLSLRSCRLVWDNGLRALTAIGGLQEVDLSHCNGVTDAGVAALGEGLPRLTSLDLSCTYIHGGSLGSFRRRPSALRALRLRECCWVKEWVLRLVATIESLESLDVMNCDGVTDRGLGHVARLPLTSLNLSYCSNIFDSGVARLAAAPSLSSLDLSFCANITDEGVGRLVANTRLERLVLNCCGRVSDDGIHALSPIAHSLRQLEISSCHGLTSQCISFIAQTFTNLRGLKLDWLGVTDTHLLALEGISSSLCHLSIKGCNNLTSAACDKLWYLEGINDDRQTPQRRMK